MSEQIETQEWPFLKELPTTVLGFSLDLQEQKLAGRTQLFSYQDDKKRLGFSAMYDKNTKEYSIRRKIGLTEFCDIDFCTEQLPRFEQLLQERMQESMRQMSNFDEALLDSIVIKKEILQWGRELELSAKSHGFLLFVEPCRPVKVINGSYMVLDYSDFLNESNLVVYYNMFRDDFFAEIRIHRLPEMTTLFDATTTKELDVIIKQHLEEVLQYMRGKIDNETAV
ncbi:hypothetical protein [Azotosporobacter soli]|uniref:hypothetical protein n=1 Tax=Azotosporobacter soli TaxID=3055040 RepID=UPI0031FE6BF5